jgi:hypothetical protein
MGCSAEEKEYCLSMYDANGKYIGAKCDMQKCKSMSAEECAAYCDKMGCSAEQKAACLKMIEAHKGTDGACMDGCKSGCKTKEECMKNCGEACASKH